MSLKNGRDSQKYPTWSLATMLTTYYACSAFLIVLLATGYLYWAMVRNLDLEDDRLLADRIRLLQAILYHEPLDTAALHQEVNEGWQSGQHQQVFIRVTDAQGNVISESKDMDESLPSSLFPAPVDQPGIGSNAKLKSGRLHRVMAVALNGTHGEQSHWVVQVGMDRREEEEILDDYRENLFVVLAASLVICTLVGYQITRRGIQPLHSITQVVSRTEPSNLSERIDTTRLPTELQRLVDTFNAMMGRLERAFNRLSSFTADIAHELRTPVNNMRGELDVALTKRRSLGEYEEIIGSSLEELGRLSRTIESLLFLARAENPQTHIDLELIDLQQELTKLREFFDATAEEAGVKIEVIVATPLKAELNRGLLQQAIGNLITNAISHTPSSGKVTIGATSDGTMVVIDVIDTGCGIGAEHLPHIFNRFYRADHSRTAFSHGVGLGLSIVKSIVELHDGKVEISSEIGEGTQVRLLFPMQTRR